MKKQAINSFIAITAMAWLGQTAQVQNVSGGSRDQRTSQNQTTERCSDAIMTLGSQRSPAQPGTSPLRFSKEEVARLRTFITQLPPAAPGASTTMPIKPGVQLSFDHFSTARVLPESDFRSGQFHSTVVDLLLQGKIVRILRNNREIIDLA